MGRQHATWHAMTKASLKQGHPPTLPGRHRQQKPASPGNARPASASFPIHMTYFRKGVCIMHDAERAIGRTAGRKGCAWRRGWWMGDQVPEKVQIYAAKLSIKLDRDNGWTLSNRLSIAVIVIAFDPIWVFVLIDFNHVLTFHMNPWPHLFVN